jgi:crotonobetainyl-CoA:carnitine CoA-transferase CaiB-like acyl-CoA transferase
MEDRFWRKAAVQRIADARNVPDAARPTPTCRRPALALEFFAKSDTRQEFSDPREAQRSRRYFCTRVSSDHLRRLSKGAQEGTAHAVAIGKTRLPGARFVNATARINKMQEYIAQRTTAEWLERLDAADVPCSPILRRGEIIQNEQVVARGLIEEFEQPTVGRVRQPKPAAIFEVNKAAIGGPAPRVGEHSRAVLRDLGYSDSAIEGMIADKAVRAASN